MGRLYDAIRKVDGLIESKGLDAFQVRGQISLKAGFFMAIVTPEDPDDPDRIAALKSAVREIIGEDLVV